MLGEFSPKPESLNPTAQTLNLITVPAILRAESLSRAYTKSTQDLVLSTDSLACSGFYCLGLKVLVFLLASLRANSNYGPCGGAHDHRSLKKETRL